MDWLDLVLKLLPTVGALIGAFVGATVGPLIARRTALDTTERRIEADRALAQETATREDQRTERQKRHDLLEPLLTAAREHVHDVEHYLYAGKGNPEPPEPRAILREDLRWSAIPSRRFDTALRRWRLEKARMSFALLELDESDNRDELGLPLPPLTEPLSQLKSAVLALDAAAEAYERDGPDLSTGEG